MRGKPGFEPVGITVFQPFQILKALSDIEHSLLHPLLRFLHHAEDLGQRRRSLLHRRLIRLTLLDRRVVMRRQCDHIALSLDALPGDDAHRIYPVILAELPVLHRCEPPLISVRIVVGLKRMVADRQSPRLIAIGLHVGCEICFSPRPEIPVILGLRQQRVQQHDPLVQQCNAAFDILRIIGVAKQRVRLARVEYVSVLTEPEVERRDRQPQFLVRDAELKRAELVPSLRLLHALAGLLHIDGVMPDPSVGIVLHALKHIRRPFVCAFDAVRVIQRLIEHLVPRIVLLIIIPRARIQLFRIDIVIRGPASEYRRDAHAVHLRHALCDGGGVVRLYAALVLLAVCFKTGVFLLQRLLLAVQLLQERLAGAHTRLRVCRRLPAQPPIELDELRCVMHAGKTAGVRASLAADAHISVELLVDLFIHIVKTGVHKALDGKRKVEHRAAGLSGGGILNDQFDQLAAERRKRGARLRGR